jgi:malate dehydrogenase (oxaloacetate-decarboxylating)
MSPARRDRKANLLPPVTALRDVANAVALAVAKQAATEGLTDMPADKVEDAVHRKMWTPRYRPYRKSDV